MNVNPGSKPCELSDLPKNYRTKGNHPEFTPRRMKKPGNESKPGVNMPKINRGVSKSWKMNENTSSPRRSSNRTPGKTFENKRSLKSGMTIVPNCQSMRPVNLNTMETSNTLKTSTTCLEKSD